MSARSDAVAALVGAAESDLGAVPGRTAGELAVQASLAALDDAGLSLDDVDGLFTANLSRFSVTQLAELLAIEPAVLDCTMTGGACDVGDTRRPVRSGADCLWQRTAFAQGAQPAGFQRKRHFGCAL